MGEHIVNILMGTSSNQDIVTPSGGSERQFLGYANALAERGHTVHVVNLLKSSPDWSIGFDLCHIVNAGGLKGCLILTAQLCRAKGIPVIMSPVYWPIDEVQKEIVDMLGEDSEQIAKNFGVHVKGSRDMFREADWLVPNAEIEMQKVAELLKGEM